MRAICSSVVSAAGDWWTCIGWTAFVVCIVALLNPAVPPVARACLGMLLAFWWVVDLIDQSCPVWVWLLGAVMLALSCLPRAGVFAIAAWVAYWTKVRE